VGTPVDFTAQYDSIGDDHSMLSCHLYAVQHPAQPEGPGVKATARQPSCPRGLRKTTPAASTGGAPPRAEIGRRRPGSDQRGARCRSRYRRKSASRSRCGTG
jgi:hypothetical protein